MSSLDFIRFGLQVFTALSSEENSVFSPNSLSTCLSMVLMGTRNVSAEELSTALFGKAIKDESQLKSLANELNQIIDKRLKSNSDALKSANFLYADKKFEVMPEFREMVQKSFRAEAKELDFISNKSQSIEVINRDISIATNGKIDKLLEDLSEDTVIVLANAIYFKGLWKSQFKKECTTTEKFTTNDNREIDIPMMFQSRKYPFGYVEALKTKAIELGYENSDAVMIVLLPDKDHSLAQLRQSLNVESLNQLIQSLNEIKVDLYLPKFKIESKFDLIPTLMSVGIKSIFSPSGADFSGLSRHNNIAVSQVLQKAVIEVTEEGTEAAAATAVGIRLMSIQFNPEFRANRPFMYLVVTKKEDKTVEDILFMGECYKPKF